MIKKSTMALLILSALASPLSSTMAAQATSTYTTTHVVDNEALKNNILARIAGNSTLANQPIQVSVNNGNVVVSGSVNNKADAQSLVQIIQNTPGVVQIDTNNLDIKSIQQQPLTDSYITGKVKAAYINSKLFTNNDVAAMTIHVETVQGVVYLTGKADNAAQLANAINIAKGVDGVKNVKSTVAVINN